MIFFTSKSVLSHFKWHRCSEYFPSVLNIVIQILSQTISTNMFMLLLCLQGALLPSLWPKMKLTGGIELVLKK